MMNRRAFLRRSWHAGTGILTIRALSALGGVVAVSCDSGGGEDGDSGGSGDTVTYVTDVAAGHAHSIEIPLAVLESPPAEGFEGTTTVVGGHAHSVMLSQAELMDISDDMDVTKNTGVGGGHVHPFTFPS